MLAYHHPSQPIFMSSAYNAFLPTIPSPLSPRSANVASKPQAQRLFMSSDQENSNASASEGDSGQKGAVAFSKRPVKKAPSPKQDELKEKRRRNFLKRVSDGREDKRFEQRGEDMMRLDFYQRQRQWEAEQARSAPTLPFDAPPEEDEEEDNKLPTFSSSAMQISAPSTQVERHVLDEEVDDVLAQEERELATLLEFMEEGVTGEDKRSEHLWSDDEDYDALFSELVEQESAMTERQDTADPDQGEAMDTS